MFTLPAVSPTNLATTRLYFDDIGKSPTNGNVRLLFDPVRRKTAERGDVLVANELFV